MAGELSKHLHLLSSLLNETLDCQARLEISVASYWVRHLQQELGTVNLPRRRYRHQCQDGRIVSAWAYPIQYVTMFDKWLWNVYFSEHFPAYQRYRARRVAAPFSALALPAPNRPQQRSLFQEWA